MDSDHSLQTGGGGGGGVKIRGGMPVSHHRDFAMMLVAKFRDAGISLGMPPSLRRISC